MTTPRERSDESAPECTAAVALLRPSDVARQLAVSRAWVYDAAKTGRIPSVRLGGEDGPLRFIPADIERWLADSRAGWLPGRSASDLRQSAIG